MIGRLASDNPWVFADVDRIFYNKPNPGYTRREILEVFIKYRKLIFFFKILLKINQLYFIIAMGRFWRIFSNRS